MLEDDKAFDICDTPQAFLEQNIPCSKFWILAAQLPDPRVLVKAFNYYFDEVHWRYNVGQRCYMDKRLEQWTTVVGTPASQQTSINKDTPYFVAFSFELLAVILQCMRPDREIARILHATNGRAAANMSRRYNYVASEVMLLLGRHDGTITVVEYDLLRASWLKNNGRGVESWYAISDGVRQAQQLNLHRAPRLATKNPDSLKNLEQFWSQEYATRTWINIFCWDTGTALNLGQPRIINAKDCDVNLPLDCPSPVNPSQTVPIPKDEHTPSPLSLLLIRYAIARKVHETRKFGLDKPTAKYDSIWAFHEELNNLFNELPPYFNPNKPATYLDSSFSYLPLHREEALSQLNLIIMELHRPFIAAQPQSRIAAMNASIGSIDNQQALMNFSGRHHYTYFGFGFYTANAAIMLAAIAHVHPSKSQTQLIEKKMKQALSILINIKSTNVVARAAIPIVKRLYEKVQSSLCQSMFRFPNLVSTESTPSRDSGYVPTIASLIDSYLAAPINTDFMINNAIYPPLQDPSGLPDWDDMPHVNNYDAAFWLDQLHRLPENLTLNSAINSDTLWS
ncbi:hypothetical protein AUEXF2481DRAFT_209234 [Aureobasidium subglaciale EXF-2481]|uniref:Xylanolytic transcriptional activator regulatory domain-containing protein n=1 Tax=Aureobasidium subglaciale (strain EXF-2481) TaxID=1043005 RepID=A0A074YQR5_AURSE|nr:uncharacterized protein AUEXF2481DRAFT_209234 [Aureobasidium subglaciale EXF-2481]KER00021.1 hypothetical protein AUEXF2481DRAFT_209234 [Aureobasidium subglaciale EXF-2481]